MRPNARQACRAAGLGSRSEHGWRPSAASGAASGMRMPRSSVPPPQPPARAILATGRNTVCQQRESTIMATLTSSRRLRIVHRRLHADVHDAGHGRRRARRLRVWSRGGQSRRGRRHRRPVVRCRVQHPRGTRRPFRDGRDRAGPGHVLVTLRRSAELDVQSPRGGEVSRRHRLQRRCGQVQLRPGDGCRQRACQRQAVGAAHRVGGSGRCIHGEDQHEEALRKSPEPARKRFRQAHEQSGRGGASTATSTAGIPSVPVRSCSIPGPPV